MSLSGKAEINVTPLIDVLLVLLIIFLVIQPPTSLGLKAEVPQPSDQPSSAPPPPNDVVITIEADRNVRLNQEAPFKVEELAARLKSVFASGASQVVFIRGDKGLEFRQVAEVIDIANGAGLSRIALMTR
jgi:biopolymer transport protein TolR